MIGEDRRVINPGHHCHRPFFEDVRFEHLCSNSSNMYCKVTWHSNWDVIHQKLQEERRIGLKEPSVHAESTFEFISKLEC